MLQQWTRDAQRHGKIPNQAYLRARHAQQTSRHWTIVEIAINLRSTDARLQRNARKRYRKLLQRAARGARALAVAFVNGIRDGITIYSASSSSQSVQK